MMRFVVVWDINDGLWHQSMVRCAIWSWDCDFFLSPISGISHIYHEGNSCMDRLANYGLSIHGYE